MEPLVSILPLSFALLFSKELVVQDQCLDDSCLRQASRCLVALQLVPGSAADSQVQLDCSCVSFVSDRSLLWIQQVFRPVVIADGIARAMG